MHAHVHVVCVCVRVRERERERERSFSRTRGVCMCERGREGGRGGGKGTRVASIGYFVQSSLHTTEFKHKYQKGSQFLFLQTALQAKL